MVELISQSIFYVVLFGTTLTQIFFLIHAAIKLLLEDLDLVLHLLKLLLLLF